MATIVTANEVGAADTSKHKFNTSYIIGISFISALGGYLFGFDFAVISGALPFLRTEFVLDVWKEGFLTGSLGLGCIAGCLFAGTFTDRYGRKPGLLLAALIFAVSSAGMAFSNGFNFFITMRFAAGIGVGMASMLSPMYIAEVSPAHVRGRNVAINGAALSGTNRAVYGLPPSHQTGISFTSRHCRVSQSSPADRTDSPGIPRTRLVWDRRHRRTCLDLERVDSPV